MSITLLKGQKLSLNKDNPNLRKIAVGIGCNNNNSTGGMYPLDLDASAFLLTTAGVVQDPKDFVFYGNLSHPSGAVYHTTNSPSAHDSDKDKIRIDLSLLPPSVIRIAFTATIYDAEIKQQFFSNIKNAYIRIYNEQTQEELLRYNLSESFTYETAVLFGEMYKNNDEWKFNAIGQGSMGGLAGLCESYGVEVG